MDNQQDQNQAEQDAQREMQQQQQEREMEAQDWAAQTPGAPENIAAPVAQAEAEAEPEAAAETENTIDPAIYDRITNPDLTAEERDKVARAMMETDQISQGAMAMGAQMTASMGIMELIKQFMGIADSFPDMQQMTGRMFEAFDKGLVTETGKLNEGVVQPLIDDAHRMAPQQPAPQAPENTQQQNPNPATSPEMGMF